jgi:hypothetical protein
MAQYSYPFAVIGLWSAIFTDPCSFSNRGGLSIKNHLTKLPRQALF